MVKQFFSLILISLAMVWPLSGNEGKISAEGNSGQAYVNQPIKDTLMVTHDKNAKIDPNSFQAGKEKLVAEFIRDVQMDPTNPLVVSIYHFELPPKGTGLYVLPAISVKVGKSIYQSVMSTYEVVGGQPPLPPP